MSYTIYIDESGNSGAGEDRGQPIFAIAAVWVPAAQQALLRSDVIELKQRHRVQMDDLKGSRLIKRERGQAFLSNLLQVLESRQLPVTTIVVEKAFMGACMLVEDVTDYVYNPKFDLRWTHPIQEKRILADYFFDSASTDALRRFIDARRGADSEVFVKVAEELIAQFTTAAAGKPFGRVVAAMADADLRSVWSDCKGPHPMKHSPNMTALQILLNEADRHAEDLGARECSLVHDAQSEFAEEIKYRAKMMMRTQTTEAERARLGEMRLPTRHLSGIRFEDSKVELGIQIADCVAAAVRVAASDPGSAAGVKSALASLLQACSGQYFPYAFGPTQWCRRTILGLLTGAAPEPSPQITPKISRRNSWSRSTST